jgi:hypothetical protein
MVMPMRSHQRKSPGESANSTRAINKNHSHIITEITGCLLTALLWGWITATAIIGMIEGRVITNATVLAAVGAVDDGR